MSNTIGTLPAKQDANQVYTSMGISGTLGATYGTAQPRPLTLTEDGKLRTETSVALDSGTINTLGTIGTVQVVSSVANLAKGTITRLEGGTLNSLEGGSIQMTAGTITSGSIVVTAGTIAAHAVTAATVTAGTIDVLKVATITVLPNLPQGSINVTAGTFIMTNGTVGAGTVAVSAGTVGGKAASGAAAVQNPVLTAGTDAGGTVYAPLMTTTGHQLIDVLSGTIQSSGTTTGVGVVTSVTNLAAGTITRLEQGSINVTAGTIGTVTGVGVVTSVTNLAAGTVTRVEGGTIGRVGNVGTLEVGTISTLPNIPGGTIGVVTTVTSVTDVANLSKGTITRLEQGSIQVTAGTIASVGTVPGVGVVTSVTNLAAGTITKLEGGTLGILAQGSINVTAGTVGGKAASGAAAVQNPVLIAGTDAGGTVYAPRVDTNGVLQINGTVSTGGAGTQDVRLIDGTLTSVSNIVKGTITRIEGGTITVTNPGGAGTQYAEDTGHATGDAGMQMLAVRVDGGTSLVNTDIDYAPLQVDANGALRISGTVATGAGTQAVRLIDGTLTSISNLAAGTVTRLEQGSINVTAGTIGTVTGVGVVTSITNLASGTLLNSGTTTGVGVVTSVTNLAAGTITRVEQGSINVTAGTVTHGTIDVGTITVGTVYKGVPAPAAGSLTAAGTITVAGSQNDVIFWEVGGTWVGTAFFESQVGTSAYFGVPVITPAGVVGTQTTANGQFIQSASGIDNARLRVTYSSGTLTHNERAANFGNSAVQIVNGSVSHVGMLDAGTITSVANVAAGTITRVEQGSINVTAGTVTAGSIVVTVGTIAAGTVAVSAGTITHGTIDAGTVKDDGRAARNILSYGTTFAGTAAAYGTLVGSASVGAGTYTWVDSISITNPAGNVTTLVGFGTALSGTSVLWKGTLGTTSSAGVVKIFPHAVNAGMTNQDLVCYVSGAGTIDVNVTYFISA